MKRINLKVYYPEIYQVDCYIELPDDCADLLDDFLRETESHGRSQRRRASKCRIDNERYLYRHAVQYRQLSDDLEKAVGRHQLYEAINKLPEVQAKRTYAYYFLDMTHREIALNEGVATSTVTQSLDRALNNLKKYF